MCQSLEYQLLKYSCWLLQQTVRDGDDLAGWQPPSLLSGSTLNKHPALACIALLVRFPASLENEASGLVTLTCIDPAPVPCLNTWHWETLLSDLAVMTIVTLECQEWPLLWEIATWSKLMGAFPTIPSVEIINFEQNVKLYGKDC